MYVSKAYAKDKNGQSTPCLWRRRVVELPCPRLESGLCGVFKGYWVLLSMNDLPPLLLLFHEFCGAWKALEKKNGRNNRTFSGRFACVMFVCMCVCMYVCVYVCMYMYVCMYVYLLNCT